MKEFRVLLAALMDKQTPAKAKWLVIAAALYGLSPVDLIPDIAPFVGLLDDLAVIIIALYLFLNWTRDIRARLRRSLLP